MSGTCLLSRIILLGDELEDENESEGENELEGGESAFGKDEWKDEGETAGGLEVGEREGSDELYRPRKRQEGDRRLDDDTAERSKEGGLRDDDDV